MEALFTRFASTWLSTRQLANGKGPVFLLKSALLYADALTSTSALTNLALKARAHGPGCAELQRCGACAVGRSDITICGC